MATKSRIETLDAFRGLAALSVVLFHFTAKYRETYNGHTYSSKYDFVYGYLGVQFFFILSGFVIFMTVQYCKTGHEFLYKRFSRLYPVFWACLLIIIVSYAAAQLAGIPQKPIELKRVLLNFTMIPKFLGSRPLDGAYWSLQVEFFFYISIFLLLVTRQMKNILYWGLLLLLFSWIHYCVYPFPLRVQQVLNTNYSCLFLAGILFYKFRTDVQERKKWQNHLFVAFCFLTACITCNWYSERIIIGVFFVLFYLFSFDKLNKINWKPLLFLGSISYPLYLVHQHIGYTLMQLTRHHLAKYPPLFIGFPLAVAIVTATLLHKFVELPSAKWLKQFKFKN